MRPQVNYALVGLFVLLLGGGAIFTMVWLTAGTADKEYDTYMSFIEESVSGLHDNALVTYSGVEVGYVSEVHLDPDNPGRVVVIMQINTGTPIKQDTVAILVSQGITGIVHVELSGGTPNSPPLEKGEQDPHPVIATGQSLLVRLDAAITTLIETLTATTEELNTVAERVSELLNEENRGYISGTLSHIEVLTRAIADRADTFDASIADAATVMRNVARFSDGLPALMTQATDSVAAFEDTAGTIDDAAAAFDDTVVRFAEVADSVENIMVSLQRSMEEFTRNTPSQIDPLMIELTQLTEAMRILANDLAREPTMLITGRSDAVPGPGED